MKKSLIPLVAICVAGCGPRESEYLTSFSQLQNGNLQVTGLYQGYIPETSIESNRTFGGTNYRLVFDQEPYFRREGAPDFTATLQGSNINLNGKPTLIGNIRCGKFCTIYTTDKKEVLSIVSLE